jgi:hypothetical protein
MTCNRCRAEIHPAAPHRKGQHAVWCEPCYAVVMTPLPSDKPLAGLVKAGPGASVPVFSDALSALKARAAMKAAPRRVVVIGGED